MGLEIGELRQVGTQLHGSEAATQEGVQQRQCGDRGGAGEDEGIRAEWSHRDVLQLAQTMGAAPGADARGCLGL